MDFKVRCTKSTKSSGFTVGKIYIAKDGTLLGDDESAYSNWSNPSLGESRRQNLESLNEWFQNEEVFELVTDKPRICEILGVEVGEHFKIKAYWPEAWINESGKLIADVCAGNSIAGSMIYEAINHPEKIIRQPQFSVTEIVGLRALVMFEFPYLARDEDNCIYGYSAVPKKKGDQWFGGSAKVVNLPETLFLQITWGNSPFGAKSYLEGLK